MIRTNLFCSRLVCQVIATDNGSPSLTSTATLTAQIVDVIEVEVEVEVPINNSTDEQTNQTGELIPSQTGSSTFISLEIADSVTSGFVVYMLTSVDLGVTLDQGQRLTFVSSGQEGVFAVDKSSGEVSIKIIYLAYH